MDEDITKFEPAFDFDPSDSSILLYAGACEISIEGIEFQGYGEARLDLSHQAGIYLVGKFKSVPFGEVVKAFEKKSFSSFTINDRSVDGFPLKIGFESNSQEIIIKWCPKSQLFTFVGNDSTQIKKVIFHLFNFVEYFGVRRSSLQKGDRTQVIEHIELACDEWNVEIKSLFTTRDDFKSLKEEGGYRLTHIGCFEKKRWHFLFWTRCW